MILLSTVLLGCSEKRIMPANPNEPMMYQLELSYDLDFEQPEIPDAHNDWKIELRLTLDEVHRDDSLSFIVEFVDVQHSSTESLLTSHSLTGNQVEVRCFPWGELLLVNGFDTISVLEDVQWLDFIFGVIFPNPPRRSGQQWQNRLLPWPYFLNPQPHSKQIVGATWIQTEKNAWNYDGTWYGKRGVTPLFDGSANGTVTATSPWVQTHELDWRRDITVPLVVTQEITGSLERIR
jgi:hypothetical protein